MLFMRSLSFHVAFFINFLLHGLLFPIALLTTRRVAWLIAVSWMRGTIFLWKLITNSTVEYRGLEHLPEGGYIVVSKHQSTWETIGLAPILGEIVFILKKELMYLPIFGWYCAKAKMIPIDRGERSKVIGPMIRASREAVEAGRKIAIFIEGTRVPAGTKGSYKIGAGLLYEQLQCPIVPIAINTGLFWPRNGFWHYSGHVIIEILPPIQPGLKAVEVVRQLETQIETASNALIIETATSGNPPPTIHKALEHLKARGVEVPDLS